MTSLATIVFKSGVAVEVPFGAAEAARLLESFDENWDEDGPQIVLPMSARSSGCRLVPSEVVGIFISETDDEEDEDDDEDETSDAEEDSAEDLDDSEDEDEEGEMVVGHAA